MLVVSFASCVDEFRKWNVMINFSDNLIENITFSASSIDRCKNEDKECLVNAWSKYIKQSGKNGKRIHF